MGLSSMNELMFRFVCDWHSHFCAHIHASQYKPCRHTRERGIECVRERERVQQPSSEARLGHSIVVQTHKSMRNDFDNDFFLCLWMCEREMNAKCIHNLHVNSLTLSHTRHTAYFRLVRYANLKSKTNIFLGFFSFLYRIPLFIGHIYVNCTRAYNVYFVENLWKWTWHFVARKIFIEFKWNGRVLIDRRHM